MPGRSSGWTRVYVIALDKKIPSEIPTLDQIRAQVVKDYQYNQALNLARRAGADFYQTLTNGLAHGKTLAAICADAKLQLVEVPPFSLSTRDLPAVEDHLPLNQYKQIAFTAPPGQASPFQMTTEGGVVVYVKAKLPLDEKAMTTTLPAFANYVRQSRQNEAFNEWFRKEAEKGLRDTPLARAAGSAADQFEPEAEEIVGQAMGWNICGSLLHCECHHQTLVARYARVLGNPCSV